MAINKTAALYEDLSVGGLNRKKENEPGMKKTQEREEEERNAEGFTRATRPAFR